MQIDDEVLTILVENNSKLSIDYDLSTEKPLSGTIKVQELPSLLDENKKEFQLIVVPPMGNGYKVLKADTVDKLKEMLQRYYEKLGYIVNDIHISDLSVDKVEFKNEDDTKLDLPSTKEVFDQARSYVKSKLVEKLKEVDLIEVKDLYESLFSIINPINRISGYAVTISNYIKNAKDDYSKHPDEIDKINEWYSSPITRNLEDLKKYLEEIK